MTEQTIKIKRTVKTLELFGIERLTVVVHGESKFLAWLQEHFYTWAIAFKLDANQRFLSVNEDEMFTGDMALNPKVELQEFQDKLGYTQYLQEKQTNMKTKVEYVEAKFEYGGDAVKAFEKGEVLYYHFSGDTYMGCASEEAVLREHKYGKLLRKMETTIPWWETISEENPVYAIGCTGRIEKVIGYLRTGRVKVATGGTYGTAKITPLTVERAEEILKTTLAFHNKENSL